MDLYLALVFIAGVAFVVILLVGIVVGIRRMQGQRSRFDGFFEVFVRSQGAGVYPPSLRGNPDPLEQEVIEVSRGDATIRTTPSEPVGGPSNRAVEER